LRAQHLGHIGLVRLERRLAGGHLHRLGRPGGAQLQIHLLRLTRHQRDIVRLGRRKALRLDLHRVGIGNQSADFKIATAIRHCRLRDAFVHIEHRDGCICHYRTGRVGNRTDQRTEDSLRRRRTASGNAPKHE
jgi:hypothetical protein